MNRWYLLSCLGVLLSFGVKIVLPPKIMMGSNHAIALPWYNKRFVDANPDRTVLFAPSLNALVAPRTFLAHTYTLLSTPHTKLCDNLLVAHSTRNVTLAACTTPTTKMAFYKCKLQLRSLLVA